jgi:hypothetical protein
VKGEILTKECLRKKGIIIVDCCCMCKSDEEPIDHLFVIVG